MFTVELFNFSKKENSTARPNRNNATSFSCVVKRGSGLVNPKIELDIGLSQSPARYNYAYIPAWDRWYWIEEWNNQHPLWVASMKVDVLATYRSAIGNSNLYILRSSATYDGDIIDSLYPTKITASTVRTIGTSMFPNNTIANGMFIIGVVCKSAQFGSIQYYAFNHSNLVTLLTALLNDATLTANGFDSDDASLALQKSLIDPLSYIKSAMFIPMSYADYDETELSSINVWDWNINARCKAISYLRFAGTNSQKITLPKHPQVSSRGRFCNVAPYTVYRLNTGLFGEVELDTSLLYNESSINLTGAVDLTSGDGYLNITAGSSSTTKEIAFLKAQVGVPIQLSQVTKDYIGQQMNAINTIGNVASNLLSGNVLGGTVGLANGIMNGIVAQQPHVSSMGSNGSFLMLYPQVTLYSTFYTLVDDDNASNGRPYCKIAKPSTLGGYMLIQDADISINATSNEIQSVRQYLESGFYYE